MDIRRIMCEQLEIKSTITPETVYFKHYPEGKPQLHIDIIEGVSGRSIFLTEENAKQIKDFLNKYY